jgi:Domain of unknown function (DUF5666)
LRNTVVWYFYTSRQQPKENIMRKRRVLGFVSLLTVLALFGAAAVADDHGGSGSDSKGFDFTGTIQALPSSGLTGDWMVANKTVHVTVATGIKQEDGVAAIGASVEVKGSLRTDGSVDASQIEVKRGANAGNPKETDFAGAVQTLPGTANLVGDWMVGGKTVHVTASTRLNQEGGTFAVGSSVEVKGTVRTDGSIDATDIELRSSAPGGKPAGQTSFRGAIESLPTGGVVGDWKVSGKIVHVTTATRIEHASGALMVGAFVEIQGTTRSDGSIDATNIEVKFAPPAGTPPPTEFRGAVESLPAAAGFIGDAVVSGRTIHITATTRIDQEDGALAVGAMVDVKGTAETDGSLDATRIDVEFGPDSAAAGQANDFHLSATVRKAGLNGSFFTTNLTLSNTGTADATVTIKFLGHDRDGRGGIERTLTVPAGATLTINDLLGSFFGIGDDFGGVRITSNVPTLVVDSTTGTPSDQGSFGQQLRATEHNDLITSDRPRSIAGVRSNGAFRTNLMLTNATESPLDVDVKLISSDGRELGSSRIHLEPLEMHQMNDAPRELGGGAETGDDARLVLSTPTSNGAFAAAASRIDNASNDPSALIPR